MTNYLIQCSILLFTCLSCSAGFYYGPTPYLSAADSPLAGLAFQQFHLEDFEDGALNTPGVTASVGFARGPGGNTDSVDADDGTIDGSGTGGWDFTNGLVGTADDGILFTFVESALGALPTHAGIVWTDGGRDAVTTFEAFDPGGSSLGITGPFAIADAVYTGTTAEDRFFGISNPAGVSAIFIRSPGSFNSIQVDHLQYGIVPEPDALSLLGASLIALVCFRFRRQILPLTSAREKRTPSTSIIGKQI